LTPWLLTTLHLPCAYVQVLPRGYEPVSAPLSRRRVISDFRPQPQQRHACLVKLRGTPSPPPHPAHRSCPAACSCKPSACPLCRAPYAHMPKVGQGGVQLHVPLRAPTVALAQQHSGAIVWAGCMRPQVCTALHSFLACQFPQAYSARQEEADGGWEGGDGGHAAGCCAACKCCGQVCCQTHC
jgi:hypothetical protein